jgi:hypothetical protein
MAASAAIFIYLISTNYIQFKELSATQGGAHWDVKRHQNWQNVDTFFGPFSGEDQAG